MKVVAHLGVKDEVELVPGCLAHLRGIGVQRIVACDLGSTDGTLDLLHGQDEGDVRVLAMDDGGAEGIETLKRRSLEALREESADWAIFLDADERWLPRGGRLEDCIPGPGVDVVEVPRYNVALVAGTPCAEPRPLPASYGDVLLHARPLEVFRRRFEEGIAPPWIRQVPSPKVMARVGCIGTLGTGGHGVGPLGPEPLRKAKATGLLVAHLPFTTPERFCTKLRNVRRIFEAHGEYFGTDMAWHWRRWLDLRDDDAVRAEFTRQVLAEHEAAQLRDEGSLRSAAELLGG